MGSAHEYTAPWQAVSAADGDLVVAVRSEKFWQRFCSALDHPELVDDPRFSTNQDRLENRDLMTDVLNAAFRAHPVAHWLGLLRDAGVPVARVRSVGQALDEAVADHNDLLHTLHHPALGPMQIVGNPIRFGRMSLVDVLPPPELDGSGAEYGVAGAIGVDAANERPGPAD
jgi:crotonobetainyl-CoA:carnitine CoA-transferase CaiB-like acyl-CoA transferase